ncbi:sterol desaturase family protein [Rhodobacterales bacterium HKCCE2091]|nr:sterol desaturase family protein [Rhodobacterales bacterium HKCCE2091]
MDDLAHGTRDKRGNWRPNDALGLPPFGGSDFRPGAVAKWLLGYLTGWNLVFLAITLVWWFVLLPPMEVMSNLSWGWPLRLLAINFAGIFLFYGAFELRFYAMRRQERRFKYNGKFPAEQPSDVFWFRSQNLDNFLRSMFVTLPIGTVIEVLMLWAFAAGYLPMTTNPVWIAVLIFAAPILHEAHFFFAHRAMHLPGFYKWCHSVHHNSINPSPWSSMSMHPVEAFLYFASLFWHAMLWSNPFVVVWQWNIAAFGAVVGHIGFDRMEVTEDRAVQSHAYAHYLHHKYFEVNYCDDGMLPWDKWFGTWHDGTPEGDRLMKERFQKKKARSRVAQNNAEVPAE